MEDKNLFREKSLDRLSSPEELSDYLRVTNPSTWAVLVSVIIILAGLLAWSCFAVIESRVEGTAQAEDGVLSISFPDSKTAEKVEVGMIVTVGDARSVVTSIGRDEGGRTIAAASADIPDGTYEAKVAYRQTRIIQLLFE